MSELVKSRRPSELQMTETVNIAEAKAKLSALVDRAGSRRGDRAEPGGAAGRPADAARGADTAPARSP